MVSRRLASALSAPDWNAVVTACSRPKSTKATNTESRVSTVRVFFRNSPAQSSGK